MKYPFEQIPFNLYYTVYVDRLGNTLLFDSTKKPVIGRFYKLMKTMIIAVINSKGVRGLSQDSRNTQNPIRSIRDRPPTMTVRVKCLLLLLSFTSINRTGSNVSTICPLSFKLGPIRL